MKVRSILLSMAIATLAVGQADAQQFFRIGTGTAGTFPVFAAKMAEVINTNVPGVQATVSSGGVEANQIKLQKGELEANMIYTWNSAQMFKGGGDFQIKVDKARAAWSMGDAYFQPIVQKNVPIKDLSEIAKYPYRTWVGPKSFSLETVIRAVLQAVGVTEDVAKKGGGIFETTPFAQLADNFADGRLDVAFFNGPIPYGMAMKVESNPGFRVIGMTPEQIKKVGELLPGITQATLPANTYKGQTEPLTVPFYKTQIVFSSDVSEELAYKITKALNEHYKEFHGLYAGATEAIQPDKALEGNFIPIHPGAERYYKEVGLIK